MSLYTKKRQNPILYIQLRVYIRSRKVAFENQYANTIRVDLIKPSPVLAALSIWANCLLLAKLYTRYNIILVPEALLNSIIRVPQLVGVGSLKLLCKTDCFCFTQYFFNLIYLRHSFVLICMLITGNPKAGVTLSELLMNAARTGVKCLQERVAVSKCFLL